MQFGVVIGEYSVALNSDGSVKNNTVDFFNNFLNNCDLYGYAPLLWDDGSVLGASAKLLNPKDYTEIKTLEVIFKYVPRSDLAR